MATTSPSKHKDCPRLCGEDYQKYLSAGVYGKIYYCKKCLMVWSNDIWQRDRDAILESQKEIETKRKLKLLKQKQTKRKR